MTSISDASAPARAGGGIAAAAVPWIIAAVVLAVLPLIFTERSSITIMNQMAITVVFALAYNMLLGQGGMLSFGHAVYMGLGGFFCMHLLSRVEDGTMWMSLPLLPIFGGLFGMLFAVMIGAFSTRKAGTVFAMISLGVGELVAACSVIIVAFFGGEEGISGDRTYAPFMGVEFFTQTEVYYLIAFWLLLSALGMWLFSRTPLGRMANAVRDNPERAEFLGYSARWVRFGSFVASGFFCGVAGALFAINYEILTEENLNLVTSGQILLVTFLGGTGFFLGPVVGAVAFTLLQTVISLHTEIWAFYAGLLFVLTVMFFPQGLTGLMAMHIPVLRGGRAGQVVGPYLACLGPGLAAGLGAVALLELVHHAEHAQDDFGLFGFSISHGDPIPWIIALIAAGGGAYLASRNAPALRDAWDHAAKPED